MTPSFLSDLGPTYYACEWIVRIAMLLVVPFRRTAEATRSWLLLIFFLPIPGLLLYLAIGRPRFPGWRAERFRETATHVEHLVARLPKPGRDDEAPVLAGKLGHMPDVGGNGVTLLEDYDATIDRLIADIDGATRHIRILVYIFADDATGGRVIAALGRAVARGLPVHVLIDPVGSHAWIAGVMDLLRASGVHVRETLPFRWLRRTRRDMRNHRKLFLIDGAIGYAGSQNIIDKDFRPGVVNRELVARVTGPAVAEMTALFLTDWYLETKAWLDADMAIPDVTGDAIVQILPSGADYPLEGFQTLLIWQLHRARRRVVITTPYFIPDEGLLGAMRTATLRGVVIDLIVSSVVDQRLVSLAQRSYYDDLLAAGVRVHLFRDYLLHAKNVSIDGAFGVIGSSNVDLRSFQLNEEVSLLLLDPGSVAALTAVQDSTIAASDTLTLEEWRRRRRSVMLAENIARLVSPLL